MFWYRMFESFKFMLYKTRRMNCDKAQYAETLDHLETFQLKLMPHAEVILPLYKKYTKTGVIEQLSDRMLLNERTRNLSFMRTKRKMVKEFSEASSK